MDAGMASEGAPQESEKRLLLTFNYPRYICACVTTKARSHPRKGMRRAFCIFIQLKHRMTTHEQFERFIESRRWQFAKSMPQIPHEYTIKEWKPSVTDQAEFIAAIQFIRSNGVPEPFFRKMFTYYYCNGYKYWTMEEYEATITIIINRAKDGKQSPPVAPSQDKGVHGERPPEDAPVSYAGGNS